MKERVTPLVIAANVFNSSKSKRYSDDESTTTEDSYDEEAPVSAIDIWILNKTTQQREMCINMKTQTGLNADVDLLGSRRLPHLMSVYCSSLRYLNLSPKLPKHFVATP